MLKHNFSISEFFYDRSFDDYYRFYLMKFNEPFEGKKLGKIIMPTANINILTSCPKDIKNNNNNIDILKTSIGKFTVFQDSIGVYGHCHFFNDSIKNVVLSLISEGYSLAPHGISIMSSENEILKYLLSAVYVKNNDFIRH
jgi:hypothetical protein